MGNFILGCITGIGLVMILALLCAYYDDRKLSKESRVVYISNKNDREITINFNDESSVHAKKYIDENNNEHIGEFISFGRNNINNASFYYELFRNKQIIKILYKDDLYDAIITHIELINNSLSYGDSLRINYTVI